MSTLIKNPAIYISGGTTPTGTLQITENGTYDVTAYASAEVDVSGITPTGRINLTENGVFDVREYAMAEVKVHTPVIGGNRYEQNIGIDSTGHIAETAGNTYIEFAHFPRGEDAPSLFLNFGVLFTSMLPTAQVRLFTTSLTAEQILNSLDMKSLLLGQEANIVTAFSTADFAHSTFEGIDFYIASKLLLPPAVNDYLCVEYTLGDSEEASAECFYSYY